MSDNQNSRAYGIIIALLLLFAGGIGWFFWQKSQTYLAEKQRIEQEQKDLLKQKAITQTLDSLSMAYSDLRTENETLKGTVYSSNEMIQQKEIVIRQIKAETAKDIDQLRKQVDDLQKTKIEYETIITALRAENAQLKAEIERLAGENTQLKGEKADLSGQVQDLAKQLEEQIRKTQSATFKASSFKIELERRNDKVTSKARRVREIQVSFDLADVPAPYQGNQKLYLVITDDKGKPVVSKNPTKATIQAPAGTVEIMAQEVKSVNVEATQRLTFNHKFDDRLKAGNYVVAVYCDRGLLGASSFRLG
jgi:hypothetical protein